MSCLIFLKNCADARHWWLMPVILATQEDHSLKPAPGKQFARPYLEKSQYNKRAGGVAQVAGVPA
jgi:hypothetical protein